MLLTGVFTPFTFNVVIDMSGFSSNILLFVPSVLCSFFLLFLTSFGLAGFFLAFTDFYYGLLSQRLANFSVKDHISGFEGLMFLL